MAWRIKDSELRDVTSTLSAVNLKPFIDMANVLTDKVAARDSRSLLDSNDLMQIELCLAAHFYSLRDQRFTEKKTLDASGKYQGEWGKGLEATDWGQQAMMLDETGFLAQMNAGGQVTIGWLGRAEEDQTDAIDRGYE